MKARQLLQKSTAMALLYALFGIRMVVREGTDKSAFWKIIYLMELGLSASSKKAWITAHEGPSGHHPSMELSSS